MTVAIVRVMRGRRRNWGVEVKDWRKECEREQKKEVSNFYFFNSISEIFFNSKIIHQLVTHSYILV